MTNYLSKSDEDLSRITINGFDIETDGPMNEFHMGSIVGDRTRNGEPEVYWNQEDMLDGLLSHRFRDGYIYATNLEFDLMGVLNPEWLTEHGYDFEVFHNGANIIYGRIRKHGNTWEFRDTFNIAPYFSVADMGEIIGLPKLDEELNINFADKNASDYSDSVMREYNVRDSRITYEFMKWFQNELLDLGGNLHVTAAKTSMRYFRRNYLDSEYAIQQPEEDIIRKSYNGYYGGRVSPFVKGHIEGPIYSFDVASLYPYCMREASFPDTNNLKYLRDGEGRNLESQKERIINHEGMSEVTVKTPEYIHKPVLPYKTEDKLAFPKGLLRDVWLPHNEIRFALERGYEIQDVGEQIYTRDSFNPFEGFVNSLFEKRLEFKHDDNPTEIIVKLLMNSLYGKFGQRLDNPEGGVFEPIQNKTFDELAGSVVKNGWVISDPDGSDYHIPPYINPLIASYVTSRGRMELYKWFEEAERQGGEVFYCDTDSIYTDVDLNPDPEKRLGEMDHEATISDLWVFGPKMYVYQKQDSDDYNYTMKGVPRSQMGEMWQAITEGESEIQYDKIAGMREAIQRGYEPNQIIDMSRSVNLNSPTKRKHNTNIDMIDNRIDTEPVTLEYTNDQTQVSYA